MRIISDTIHEPWAKVFKMNIIEFFNILCYVRDWNAEEERKTKKYYKR